MPERHPTAPADQTSAPDLEPTSDAALEKKPWLDLSPVQIVGGALAAMTAAGLGSRFSVEGTILGAALASVIAAVASAFYTASLRRTSAAVRGALGGRRVPLAGADRRATPEPAPRGSTAAPETAIPAARSNRRRNIILSSLVGTVAMFAIAAGALTTYEAFAGRALSGGSGTTFSQVQQDDSADQPADDEQEPAPNGSAEPSATTQPSAEPTETSGTDPTPMAEPSTEPSAEASSEPSVTAGPEPSETAGAPSVAPSQPAGEAPESEASSAPTG